MLTGSGYTVQVYADNNSSALTDAAGTALVIISSTVRDNQVGSRFRDIDVPVLVWEHNIYDDMNMASGGRSNNESNVLIVNDSHSLAAMQTGRIGVVDREWMTYGTDLGSGAITIATTEDNSQYTIFAYDTGATMLNSDTAPHRRVGFYLEDDGATSWTATGQSLFTAAVHWAINGD